MAMLKVALSEREVAAARRQALALRSCVSGAAERVEVDAATLLTVLGFFEAVRTGAADEEHAGSDDRDEEISPEEAAGLLQMSRPSVMRLIAMGELHARKVLSRNRLSRAEVLTFHERNTRARRKALLDMSALSEEHDF